MFGLALCGTYLDLLIENNTHEKVIWILCKPFTRFYVEFEGKMDIVGLIGDLISNSEFRPHLGEDKNF